MESKPTKVETGQRRRWHDDAGSFPYGRDFTVRRRGGSFYAVFDDGNEGGLATAEYFEDHSSLLGPSPQSKERGRVEWERWLPPGPLPDTGPKRFVVGQVWAWCSAKTSNDPMVFRVIERADKGAQNAEALVRPKYGAGLFWATEAMGSTVLVADVGCEPTPPEILYAPRNPRIPRGEGESLGCSADKPPAPAVGQRRCSSPDHGLGPFVVESVDGAWCGIRYERTGNWYKVQTEDIARRPLVSHGETQQRAGAVPGDEQPKTPPPSPPPPEALTPWYVVTGIDWGAGIPVKREVSHNGRDWTDYGRLTDADPFTSYKHRRENGIVIAAPEARGYGGHTWQQHVTANQNFGVGMRQRDHENPVAAIARREAAAFKKRPPDPTPGANTPQAHAYSTPSQRTR